MKTVLQLSAFYGLCCFLGYFGDAEASVLETPKQIYHTGKQAMARHQWNGALEKFHLLNSRYPNNSYLEETQANIILCYLKKRNFKQGLTLIYEFLEQHPNSIYREQVLIYHIAIQGEVQREMQNMASIQVIIGTWTGMLLPIMISHLI